MQIKGEFAIDFHIYTHLMNLMLQITYKDEKGTDTELENVSAQLEGDAFGQIVKVCPYNCVRLIVFIILFVTAGGELLLGPHLKGVDQAEHMCQTREVPRWACGALAEVPPKRIGQRPQPWTCRHSHVHWGVYLLGKLFVLFCYMLINDDML